MLQSIRDRASGWLAWLIVGLISIPFALWGVNQYFTGGAETVVAEVAGQEITLNQFQRAYQNRYRRLQSLYGDRFDPGQIDQDALRRQVLESMVRDRLLTRHAIEAGFAVSDAQLAARIYELPAFQQDGEFSRDVYRRRLAQQGMTPAGFEDRFRGALQTRQLRDGITNTAFVTGQQVADYVRIRDQERKVAFLRVSADAFVDDVTLEDGAVRDYYEANASRFMTEERVRLRYVALSEQQIRENIEVSEKKLRELYRSQKDRYTTTEERRARHILIETGDDPAAAREKARELRQKLLEGADFAKLAREHSDDPGSAEQGGSLGWISPGTMAEPFEDALYDLEETGDISPVVKTQFGFHIIKLTGIRGGETESFEAVRDELARRYRERVARDRIYDRSERLANLAFENPGTLQPAADALGLEVRTTGWITRDGGEGLGQFDKVVDAAFSPAVLQDRTNSEVLELSDGRLVVVRVDAHEPAERRALKTVRDRIEKRLRQRRAGQRAEELGRQLLDKARNGTSLSELAGRAGVSYQAPGPVGRDATGLPPELVDVAFRMPHPGSDGGPGLETVRLGDGDFAVLALHEVIPGDPQALSSEERGNLREQLSRRQGSAEFDAFVAALRQEAEVSVYPGRI